MHGTVTPTQRAAIERHQQFRASIAAKADELANRRTQLKLAAIPIAAVEAPLVSVPAVEVVAPDTEVKDTDSHWFVLVPPGHGQPTIRDIQKAVCKHYGVTLAEMLSGRRSAYIAMPRQVAYYLCKHLTLATLPQIGRRFGGRDHSSVHHGVAKIARLLKTDEDLAKAVSDLQEKLQ